MQKQWREKKPEFVELATAVLLGVYEGSSAKIASEWKEQLLEAMHSRFAAVWDFSPRSQ